MASAECAAAGHADGNEAVAWAGRAARRYTRVPRPRGCAYKKDSHETRDCDYAVSHTVSARWVKRRGVNKPTNNHSSVATGALSEQQEKSSAVSVAWACLSVESFDVA